MTNKRLCSATAKNALSGAEDSNPQRVEAPQVAHRHDCTGEIVFGCEGCALAYAMQLRRLLAEASGVVSRERWSSDFRAEVEAAIQWPKLPNLK
jgi:hypothetical protein